MPLWLYSFITVLLTGQFLFQNRLINKKLELIRREVDVFVRVTDERVERLEGSVGGLIQVVHEQGLYMKRYEIKVDGQIQQLIDDIPSIDC